MTAKLPMLTGYRVLDITQFVAGPTCTRIMAELGAEVIKLELAPSGDRGRASGDKPRDDKFKASSQSTYFFQHNHSKKSLAIDIKHARGRELIRSLVPKIDVLVENFTPGVMARVGLGYDELSAIHPPLIMCSISLAGQTGPLSRKPGFECTCRPDRRPGGHGREETDCVAADAVRFELISASKLPDNRENTGNFA